MNYTVIGAAKSGLSAALLAKRLGHDVFVTESKSAHSYTKAKEEFDKNGIKYEFGFNSNKALEHCDIIISSPGVPPDSEIIKSAEKKGIKIISELEFAYQHLKNPIIAITGTNGKTTTTALTAFIFNQAGRKAVAAGNIGTPLSDLVGNIDENTVIIAEVSSFQLDRIDTFCPQIAMILNISPDHLYYHGTMEKYIEAKWKSSFNQSEKNLLILNRDDDALRGGNFETKAERSFFSLSPVSRGIYCENGMIKIKLSDRHKTEELMLISELSLPGVHNVYNSMAAALAARAFEITNENIRDSLMKFQGVEHRLEFVRCLDGVDYVNDSKATNINATWYALSSYSKPIVWIAGGRGDSNDYSQLNDEVKKNVKSIIAVGEEADNIFNHFCLMKRCRKAHSLEEALAFAQEEAEDGDIVLFTPACKSFDMFMSYEHRGEVFKEIVNSMI